MNAFDMLYCTSYVQVYVEHSYANLFEEKLFCVCDDYVRLITVTVEAAQA